MLKTQSAIALLLLAAMLTTCGVGCGQSSAQTGDTTASSGGDLSGSTEKTRLDELGKRDFEGREFVILNSGAMNLPSDESSGDVINDSLIARDSKISELYNVKIRYIDSLESADNVASMVRQGVLAGDDVCNLIMTTISGGNLGVLATEGVLANLLDNKWLTPSANYWSSLIYENCTLGGKMYYTGGDISPEIYRAASCYYANKNLLTDYKIETDEIYDTVDAGKWTLDYMNKLAGELDRDLNGDDNIDVDNDFFGILNENNELTSAAFMTAAGIKLSTNNPDNTITVDLNNEKSINVIDKLESVLSHVPYNGQNIHEAFKSDRVVFLMHYSASSFVRYRDMNSEFMILPMPKYDESQPTYSTLVNTWANGFIGIPVNADQDFTGFVTEALAYESRQSVRPGVYDLSFKNKGARSERDADMLDLIFDTLYLDFNSFMYFGKSVATVRDAIFNEADFASGYAAIANVIEEETAKFAENWLGNGVK